MKKTPLSSRTVTIDGRKIYMRTALQGKSSHPVILIHGLAVSSRYMVPLAEVLASEYTVYAPDFPGFGKTAKPDHTLTIPELSDFLLKYLKAIGVKKAVLLGNSFGCQIIADFAMRHPNKVTHTILVAPTMDEKDRTLIQQFLRLLMDIPHEPLSYLPVLFRECFDVGIRKIIRNTQNSLEDSIKEKLPKIKAPTLVVRGEKDPIVPLEWTKKVTTLIPDARLVTIPNAGHVVNFNSPKILARVVKQFLDSN